ncbi:MAG: ABC transporter permease [Prolixibacteraceae bacterium]|jgi:phospholipid/cholesterol/gamma-HCH transport system permease protein|nr:ABC transporter permease [Prolixibacteraceae bacterium]HNQ38734.1 ABC transporter permease [Prolixibacteraceae bacterium]HOY50771.1 ABC transporter permease [Prolixibacteraceae bacterium]HPJ79072.1 ABC transporter permease [Prolixibacteraceae bacterium]HRV89533.1 ABC transporter permease [Prolixibacteraceae bacterium]
MNYFFHIGRYFWMLGKVFARPEKHKMYVRQLFREIEGLGINSVGIVVIISLFTGGIMTIQFAYNLMNPIFPTYLIGLGTRDVLILEFSSTILALILAGKIGSNITSEIGSMKVTEQIDSLEIMGVNSISYLILPKIVAVVFVFPFLVVLSIFFGLVGGLIVGPFVGVVSLTEYIDGIRYLFVPYYVTFSLIKSLFFGFLVSSVPAYFGYFVQGGALEVGKASTRAVVNTNILILLFDLILTRLLLT